MNCEAFILYVAAKGGGGTVVGSLSGYMFEYMDVRWVKRDVVCVESRVRVGAASAPVPTTALSDHFCVQLIHFNLQAKAGWRLGGGGGGSGHGLAPRKGGGGGGGGGSLVTMAWLQERGER